MHCRDRAGVGRPQLQDAGDVDKRQFIGVGAAVKRRDRIALNATLESSLTQRQLSAYKDPSGKLKNVLMYKQADLPMVGTINARSYGRAISRISYYVEVRVTVGRPGQRKDDHFVAEVQNMCRVQELEGAGVLRLALCKVFAKQDALCDGDLAVVVEQEVKWEMRAIPLTDIRTVLVSARPRGQGLWSGAIQKRTRHYYPEDVGKIFFAVSANLSRST